MNAVRSVFAAYLAGVTAPRVTAAVWLLFTLPALFVVLPVWLETDAVLRHHADAAGAGPLPPALDADLGRIAPVRLVGAIAFAALAGAFLAGGILGAFPSGEPLVSGDRRSRSFHFGQFVGECGYRTFVNVRVVLIGAGLALVLGFGVDVFERRVLDAGLGALDPSTVLLELGFGRIRPPHVVSAWQVATGLAFLALVGLAKLAMARLAVTGGHGAIGAWWSALVTALCRPLASVVSAALLALVWVAGGASFGAVSDWLVTRHGLVGVAFAVDQLGVLVGVWTFVAALLVARDIVTSRGVGDTA